MSIILNERAPLFKVLLSFTVVTGGNEHFPDVTAILDSSFLMVLVSGFPVGTTNDITVSETPASHVEGYFTEKPSSSFLYSESLSETFVVSLTGAEDVVGGVLSSGVFGVLFPPKAQTTSPIITKITIIVIDFFIFYNFILF